MNALKTYQQVYIYLVPILSNLGFINIIVVVSRLHYFRKHLKRVGEQPSLSHNPCCGIEMVTISAYNSPEASETRNSWGTRL